MIKKVTPDDPESKERCVHDLIRWLARRDLFQDVNIYANGLCWSTEKRDGYRDADDIAPGVNVFVGEEPDPASIVEYFNPELVNMSFEGPLYDAVNYGIGHIEEALNEFFEKRGLYFEYGYAWSLSTYQN